MKFRITLLAALSGLLCSPLQLMALPLSSTEPGTVLLVESLHWQLDGPFAQRHLELRIQNAGTQVLETTLQLPLAADERLQSYALDVAGQALVSELLAEHDAVRQSSAIRGRIE